MGSSFLTLTNNLLRRINEVELLSSNFSSQRGMQSVAKDCVQDSIREICQQRWEWPFHAYQHTQTLQVAEPEYAWPDNLSTVDWNSFQIVKDPALDVDNTHLTFVNRDEWYTYQKDEDEDSIPDGIRVPKFVYRAHGNGFGISPSPNQQYTIEFRYFKHPTQLVNYDDTTDIPSQFDNVILWGSLYHMNLFRENPQGTTIAEDKFKKGISNMYSLLLGKNSEHMQDTRVNFGGQPRLFTGNYHL